VGKDCDEVGVVIDIEIFLVEVGLEGLGEKVEIGEKVLRCKLVDEL
jgi:hypothetical protein